MTAAVVRLESVGRAYEAGGEQVHALMDVSLDIEAGQITAILGPSGSGKSTLLNLIGLLDTPTSGRLWVNGHAIHESSAKQRRLMRRDSVAFVFQSLNLYAALTALENIEIGAHISRSKNGAQQCRAALGAIGLEHRERHFPHQLSGGEQQRVAIARAMVSDAPVLLADEPTGELDQETGARISELLRRRAADGGTVIVATHDHEVAEAADRVLTMKSGYVVSDVRN